MHTARTAPDANGWPQDDTRQRLIPPGRLYGERLPRYRYGQWGCILLMVLGVHALVAGGLLLWPRDRSMGGRTASVAMVFEQPPPPAQRPMAPPEAQTVLPETLPDIAAPAIPQAEAELPLPPLLRKLSVPAHGRSVAEPVAAPAARSASAQAPLMQAAPSTEAQAKGAEKLACSPVHARYPAMARQLHEEGEALVQVELDAGGQVVQAHLLSSTGYDDLDDQAVLTARSMRCTPPAHPPLTGRIPVAFHIQ